jgi:electron transfer flavoprotein alpha subunit
MTVWIESDLCNGCKRCLKTCPYDAVAMVEGKARISERCTSCGACLAVCPQAAIETDVEPRRIPDFSDRKGVWVFAEQRDGQLHRVSLELLGKAQELARDLHEDVSAVLLGSQVAKLSQTLINHGADRVYLKELKALKDYRTTAYAKILTELIKTYKPSMLLMGATHMGRDLAPRVSIQTGAGLTADCTDLTIDPDEGILLQTRPAFGGNVMATIANRYSRPQMATVRPGVMQPASRSPRNGEVVRFQTSLKEREIGTKVLEKVKEKARGVGLHAAKVIVAAGRGVGSKQAMKQIFSLAEVMGGDVAGTRIIVEQGWLPSEKQVGQTGQTVRPDIYIACGISGAIQHRAGMLASRYIIAINTDKAAPIFDIADWGLVGDLHEIVPRMTDAIRAKREA